MNSMVMRSVPSHGDFSFLGTVRGAVSDERVCDVVSIGEDCATG